MTTRQQFMKLVYPFKIHADRNMAEKPHVLSNDSAVPPYISFHSLAFNRNNGMPCMFDKFKGKKVLVVNTASDCLYTKQYGDLQKLYKQFEGKLEILAFPSSDFKDQEKGTDEEIAAFCKKNYGVSFMIMQKSVVKKQPDQNPVFNWLTRSAHNGWNNQEPQWNFGKFLVNEHGMLVNYWAPSVSPLSRQILRAVQK
ncbi:MAG: glutathione peroxidase [Chitinophagaceae bacterium]|nr:glutathione peroxidase [Chitinophagaceae bacterium]